MAYIPNTTVKPQLSTPNSFTNPYDGSVGKAMGDMFDKGIGIIDKELAERATEQQALQALRTEQFNAEYAANLKQGNAEFATLVSAGQASMDFDSYKKFAVDRFNQAAKDKQWYFANKVERAKAEKDAFLQIFKGYDSFVSTDLKSVAKEQAEQLVTNKMQTVLEQAGDPTTSPEKLIAEFNSGPYKSMMGSTKAAGVENVARIVDKSSEPNKDSKPAKGVLGFESQIYAANTNAKINLYFDNKDINSLTKLEQDVTKNTFFDKEQRKKLVDDINSAKTNIEGAKEAANYLVTYKKPDGTPDMEAIIKDLDQRGDVDESKRATVKAQLKRMEDEQETSYQEARTSIFDKLLAGGDSPESILLNEGQALRGPDKLLIRDYAKVTASNYDLYNQLQQKIMRMEKVDLIKDGVAHLTPNDLKDLQTLQKNLKGNSELQKQASSINKLMDGAFKRNNITDKTQQQDLYAMVLEEIRGQERVKGELMNGVDRSKLITEFMKSMDYK